MGHSFGHDVTSDWADKADDDPVFGIWKQCGTWTDDERAILAACAGQFFERPWCDIGCNTGATAKTINWETSAPVICVDYMLGLLEFRERFLRNTGFPLSWTRSEKSDEFFRRLVGPYAGVVIDGDHDGDQPLVDADYSSSLLNANGVILLHDGVGRPVRRAVEWLMRDGFKARAYFTPYLVFCCWRGDFTPPHHVPDPAVKAALLDGRFSDFDFGRMS
jgi:hypothetical protein